MKTKEELEVENGRLAEGINAKDSEIAKLNEDLKIIRKEVKNLRDDNNANVHLKESVEAKDKEIAGLKESIAKIKKDTEVQFQNRLENANSDYHVELEKVKAENEKNTKLMSESYEKRIADIQAFLNRRMAEFDRYIDSHVALLKTLQGVTDSSVILNDMMIKEIKS